MGINTMGASEGEENVRWSRSELVNALGKTVVYNEKELNQKFDDLAWLVDENLLAKYKEWAMRTIQENPWSEAIVAQETEKLWIWAQVAVNSYQRQFRSIFDNAANDNISFNDDTDSMAA